MRNSIGKHLSAIQNAIEKQTEAIKKQQQSQAAEQQRHFQTDTKVVVSLPVEITEYHRSEQDDRPVQNRRDRIRLGLEFAGILVALAIAYFTYRSLNIFNGQLQQMRTQTEISERPCLSAEISPASGIMWSQGSPSMSLKLSLRNVGKSVAKNIQVEGKIVPVDDTFPSDPITITKQNEICGKVKFVQFARTDLFPIDKPFEERVSISGDSKDVASKAKTASKIDSRKVVGLAVVGCVNYLFSFQVNPGQGEAGQTFFAFHIAGNFTPLADETPNPENMMRRFVGVG
jgi:hypothetical protein